MVLQRASEGQLHTLVIERHILSDSQKRTLTICCIEVMRVRTNLTTLVVSLCSVSLSVKGQSGKSGDNRMLVTWLE